METTIKQIEDMSLNAWPSHKMELYDGWILRFSYLLYKVPGKCAIVYLFRDCYQCFEGEGTVSRPEAYAHTK